MLNIYLIDLDNFTVINCDKKNNMIIIDPNLIIWYYEFDNLKIQILENNRKKRIINKQLKNEILRLKSSINYDQNIEEEENLLKSSIENLEDWNKPSYFFYILETEEYIILDKINKFFKQFTKLNVIKFEVSLKNKSVMSINIICDDLKLIKIKNYILFVGSSRNNEELNNEKEKFTIEYIHSDEKEHYILKKNYQKLLQLCKFLKDWGINIKNINVPYNITWQIFYKNFNLQICSIKKDCTVYDKHSFIYKYFIVLCHKYNIKFNSESIINLKFIYTYIYRYFKPSSNGKTLNEMKLYKFLDNINNQNIDDQLSIDKGNLDLTDKTIRRRLNNIINDKNLFNNCMIYLNSNYPLILNNDDIFYNLISSGRREIISNLKKSEKMDDCKIYVCDLPNAYFNGLSGLFPEGLPISTNTIYSYDLKIDTIDPLALYDVYVESFGHFTVPVLPYKKQKTIYPVGRFRGLYFGEELIIFLKYKGIILRCYAKHYWNERSPVYLNLFNTINENEKYRKETNPNFEDKWIYKVLKTTFFGSLGISKSNIKKLKFLKYENEQKNIETISSELNNLPPRNLFHASLITLRTRIKIIELTYILYENKIKVLRINVDSIEFYCNEIQFNNLKQKYPQFNYFWDKNKQYKDTIYINNTKIIRKKNDTDLYIQTSPISNGNIITFSDGDMYTIFSEFHNNLTDDRVQISGNIFKLNSYGHRIWDKGRHSTTPILINELDPFKL